MSSINGSNTLIGIGVILLLFCLIFYTRILWHQYQLVREKENEDILRLVVLSVRSAVLVPGFALCFFVVLVYPYSNTAMQIPEAFFQSYAVFSFYAFTNLYVGGPHKCLEIFKNSPNTEPSCLFKCMNDQPERCYAWSYWAHWQYCFLRPPVVVLAVISYYLNIQELFDFLSFVTFLMVCWAVTGLFKTYHVLHIHCKGLNSFTKIFIVKTTVGLVLGEGTLLIILQMAEIVPDPDSFAIQVYCFIVLVELVIISCLLLWAFAVDMDTSKGLYYTQLPRQGKNSLSFGAFLWEVIRIQDVFDAVKLKSISSSPILQSKDGDEGALTPRTSSSVELTSATLSPIASREPQYDEEKMS